MNSNIFDRISFLALFFVIVLLPVFVLPFTKIPVEISKGLLLVVGLAVSIIFWLIARFSDGKVVIPRSVCLLGAAGVVLATLLSAFFSGTRQVSLFGTMFDIGTFWFIFTAFLLMVMSSIVFSDAKKARTVLLGTVISSAVVLLFQGVRLFAPGAFSLGLFTTKIGNVFGSWNALGVFAGFSVILSLIVIEFFSISKTLRTLLQVLILLSLLMVAAVNFGFVWGLLGLFSLIIFVYKISVTYSPGSEDKKSFPISSFAVVMITLFFFVSGQFLGGILTNKLALSNNEIAPSFKATLSVTKAVLKTDPIFGLGPNKFSEAWALHKPVGINVTQFWDIPFNSGQGLFFTFAATTGILGILAWLAFFGLFLFTGVKYIFAVSRKELSWQLIAFFVLSTYLFIASFFYFTGVVVFLMAFAFTGIFIGMSSSGRPNGEIHMAFLDDHRKSFFSILIMIFAIIACAGASFKYIERFTSFFYFEKALASTTIEGTESYMAKSLRLYTNDLYLRAYAQTYLVKLNTLISKGSSLTDEEKKTLQPIFDQALNGAQLAVTYNPVNHLNHQAVASVYQNAVALGVKDSADKAIEEYQKAAALNPTNPGIQLAMSRVYLASKKVAEAKDAANAALQLKPNYITAFIILSQIARAEGNNSAAISYAEKALAISPTNADLLKYVSALKSGAKATPPATDSVDKKDKAQE